MKMIAFAVPILEGKLEDWKNMILGNMLGENKKATDESREFAGVQERSYLQKRLLRVHENTIFST